MQQCMEACSLCVYIPATRGKLKGVDVRGTACSVATGCTLLSKDGSTTAVVVVVVLLNVGCECEIA